MKNIKATIKGTTLTLEIDLSKDYGPSRSGKTIIIASTEGNVTPDGYYVTHSYTVSSHDDRHPNPFASTANCNADLRGA